MGAAIRIILIIVIAWYVIRVINQLIAPALFGKQEKKKTSHGKSEKEFRKSTSQGEVTIKDYGKRSKDVRPGEDDFIDFEEVE